MNAQTVTIDQPLAPTQMRDGQQRLEAREQAALRRVAAQMTAEAAELPPTSWVAQHLRLEVDQWGERMLPELARVMAAERRQDTAHSWVRRRTDRCPLTWDEEASLRRVASLLRAEAGELGPESSAGTRLDRWGIQLALECENTTAPRIL
jgi:hypothetical protein